MSETHTEIRLGFRPHIGALLKMIIEVTSVKEDEQHFVAGCLLLAEASGSLLTTDEAVHCLETNREALSHSAGLERSIHATIKVIRERAKERRIASHVAAFPETAKLINLVRACRVNAVNIVSKGDKEFPHISVRDARNLFDALLELDQKLDQVAEDGDYEQGQ